VIAGPDGWMLTPEGAALHVERRVAVVADVHLGYEWARGRGGDALPAHSLRETMDKLGSLLRRAPVDRLIVAGDLVESPRRCARTEADLATLYRWLEGLGVELVPVLGNHDPQGTGRAPSRVEVHGWTIHHGHRAVRAGRTISGHHHPVLRSGSLNAPCFVVADDAIILPAFTPNAAGLPVGSAGMPPEWCRPGARCVATLGGEILDFGPLLLLMGRL
jgi:uncharacterized protein